MERNTGGQLILNLLRGGGRLNLGDNKFNLFEFDLIKF